MKSIRTHQAQVSTGAQTTAESGRRAYSAPKLTTFGSVSALTAGGSGGGMEGNMGMGMGMMNMMNAVS
jgi:hypothetical protein